MLQIVTPPAAEPVSLDEAKLHLRVDGTAEDTLITSLIAAARQEIEFETGRALMTQTWDYWLDGWPCGGVLALPLPPLQSVTSIKYFDTANAEATLASSSYYVDVGSTPGRVVLNYGQAWPATMLRPANGVCVRFVAGFGNSAAVPAKLTLALKVLLAWLYENRGDGSAQSPELWPSAVRWLCDEHRVRRGFA